MRVPESANQTSYAQNVVAQHSHLSGRTSFRNRCKATVRTVSRSAQDVRLRRKILGEKEQESNDDEDEDWVIITFPWHSIIREWRDPIHQSCRLCAFFWDRTSLPVRTYILEARNVSESKLGEVDAEKFNDPYCNK